MISSYVRSEAILRPKLRSNITLPACGINKLISISWGEEKEKIVFRSSGFKRKNKMGPIRVRTVDTECTVWCKISFEGEISFGLNVKRVFSSLEVGRYPASIESPGGWDSDKYYNNPNNPGYFCWYC